MSGEAGVTIAATYVAANRFSVAGNRVDEAFPGLRWRCDMGVAGFATVTGLSAMFTGGVTVVTTFEHVLASSLAYVGHTDLPAGSTLSHAEQHAAGARDELSPDSIGAVPQSALGVSVATLENGKVPPAQLPAGTGGDAETVATALAAHEAASNPHSGSASTAALAAVVATIPTTAAGVGLGNVTNDAQVKRSERGVAGGVASLGEDGRVPVEQLPAGTGGDAETVATALAAHEAASNPHSGSASAAALAALDAAFVYHSARHATGGADELTPAAIGAATGTALAYETAARESHVSDTGNPHGVSAAQVGLGNVTNDAQVKRSEMGVAGGPATLDANERVIQNPANATATPAATKIVLSDASGTVDAWVTDATTSVKGKVQLATTAETVAGSLATKAVTPAGLAQALSGIGGGGLIDTRVTAGQTLEAGRRYRGFLSSAQSFPLPSSPADGATVTYLDAGRNSATYNATLGRGDKTINGISEDFNVDENGAEITLVYDSTTGDWAITLNIPGNN